MKVAVLNDTHCGIRNSSEIFLKNAEDFYSQVFFPYCRENGIEQILHLGDYYDHRKFVNFKALNHNRKVFLDPLRKYGMKMDIIPGNHDTYYKNTNDLNSLKELLGHYMNEVHIIMDPTVMEYGSLKIALIPWINSENFTSTMKFVNECKADWLGGHLELSGFEVMRGLKNSHGMDAAAFKRFEMVLSGHYHAASRQENIWYLGSQMEFFWNDCNDSKYFHILDTDTRELTPVRNPITIYEKIYYDHENMNKFKDLRYLDNKFVKVIVTNKGDPYEFERFIDRVQAQKIHELKIQEDFKEFIGENVGDEEISLDDTETIVYNYIDAVNTDLDKSRIKKEISDLMMEAQTMEIV